METTRGVLMCNAIAVCIGLWSQEIGTMVAVCVLALGCKHFHLLTKPVDGATQHLRALILHDSHLSSFGESVGLLVGG